MWVPAIEPFVVKRGYQLQVLWLPGCPVAQITNVPEIQSAKVCPLWRHNILAAIVKEHPALVLVTERTSDVFSSGTTLVTATQWTKGLEASIDTLKSKTTNVVVIGDIPAFTDESFPSVCLSSHPTDAVACATPRSNTVLDWQVRTSAEAAAAKSTSVGFINPAQWMCQLKECYEIEGSMPSYFDWEHVSSTYAAYLSGVFGAALSKYLPAVS